MNKRRIGWISFAVLAFIVLIPIAMSAYADWAVYNQGSLVGVTITHLPSPMGTKSGFMNFEMDGQEHHMRINGATSGSLHIGEQIQLKYLEEYKNHFLFPNENPIGWDVGALVMMLFLGVVFIYYACKKDPPSFRALSSKKA
jgi:hypothetical protein